MNSIRTYLFLVSSALLLGLSAQANEFAIVGDAGKWAAGSKLQLESIQRTSVRSLIMPGDNLYSGTYQSTWGPWQKAGFNFDIVAIGNHNGGYAKEVAFFGMPAAFYAESIPGLARFVVLNSDDKKTVNEQMQFLDRELTAAVEPMVFLVYHHPTYNVSSDHTWDERRDFQLALRRRLTQFRKKITAVIIGHDHLAALGHFADVPYILSGASWNIRSDRAVNNIQQGVSVRTDWFFDDVPYWVKLSFTARGRTPQARVDFIRASDDQVRCTSFIETGAAAVLGANCAPAAQTEQQQQQSQP